MVANMIARDDASHYKSHDVDGSDVADEIMEARIGVSHSARPPLSLVTLSCKSLAPPLRIPDRMTSKPISIHVLSSTGEIWCTGVDVRLPARKCSCVGGRTVFFYLEIARKKTKNVDDTTHVEARGN